jgi:hypothetical protein
MVEFDSGFERLQTRSVCLIVLLTTHWPVSGQVNDHACPPYVTVSVKSSGQSSSSKIAQPMLFSKLVSLPAWSGDSSISRVVNGLAAHDRLHDFNRLGFRIVTE